MIRATLMNQVTPVPIHDLFYEICTENLKDCEEILFSTNFVMVKKQRYELKLDGITHRIEKNDLLFLQVDDGMAVEMAYSL